MFLFLSKTLTLHPRPPTDLTIQSPLQKGQSLKHPLPDSSTRLHPVDCPSPGRLPKLMGVLDDRRHCSVPPSCSLRPEDDEIHSCVRGVLAEGEQRHEEVPPVARSQQLLVPAGGGLPETGE